MVLADCEAMLVTQSEHGMTLVVRGGEAIHVPALPVKVRDVSGAGDTVAAVLALTLAARADWETRAADGECGGCRRGRQEGHRDRDAGRAAAENPAPCRRWRPKRRSCRSGGDLDAHLADWRQQELRIGFTNGCFDILHPGHVKVLTAARGACDRLIVGLNSDASVKRLKGEGRPVQDERARAEVLAALEAVDLVAIFEEDTPIDLIAKVEAKRAGQGRRLHPRAGRRPRDRRGCRRRGRAGRHSAEATARRRWSTARGEARREPGCCGSARCRRCWRYWRDRGAVDARLRTSLPSWLRSTLPLVDDPGGDFRACWLGAVAWVMDWRAYGRIAETADLLSAARAGRPRRSSVRCGRTRHGARGFTPSVPPSSLLVLPGLFYHFERSSRGMWVFVAFLVSCALLMVMSWIVA